MQLNKQKLFEKHLKSYKQKVTWSYFTYLLGKKINANVFWVDFSFASHFLILQNFQLNDDIDWIFKMTWANFVNIGFTIYWQRLNCYIQLFWTVNKWFYYLTLISFYRFLVGAISYCPTQVLRIQEFIGKLWNNWSSFSLYSESEIIKHSNNTTFFQMWTQ